MLTPQIPTPAAKVQTQATRNSSRNAPEIAAPTYHHAGVFCIRTRSLTRAVTEAKSCSGPMAASRGRASSVALLGIAHVRVGIADQRLVARPWPRVERVEHDVVERARLALRHRARRIILVSENDGLGRAGLLTGGHRLAVAQRAVLAVGVDHGGTRALHAVGAFLHHAAAPHRDVRVPGLARPRIGGGVVEEVEAPDLVGAIV